MAMGCAISGLSPRGRGNRRPRIAGYLMCRSIPAWAGEPCPSIGTRSCGAVYPRVGGGTSTSRPFRSSHRGLSPRGRGNPEHAYRASLRPGSIPAWAGEPPPRGDLQVLGGSIPAWAGEPLLGRTRTCVGWVYPRVGGGTSHRVARFGPRPGLSPRGRGNLRCPVPFRTTR